MEEQQNYDAPQSFDTAMQGFQTVLQQMALDAVMSVTMKQAERISQLVNDKFKTQTIAMVDDFLQRSGVSELRQRVIAVPKRIEVSRETIDQKRQAFRNLRQSLGDAEQSVKEAEAMIIAYISADKITYPNDTARKAALTQIKKNDDDYLAAYQTYQSVKRRVEESENELATYETELKCLEYEFTAAVAQLQSVTAEIGFYAAALSAAGEVKF